MKLERMAALLPKALGTIRELQAERAERERLQAFLDANGLTAEEFHESGQAYKEAAALD